ncbi:oxygenase MpaB family protein [Dactylosporangium siamense]|uniref:Peptidase n=1 Tax=Dactylosporangium siamense TaxID=685454 RepID=A0A919PG72_9ACTN|nr:oxygenase MpaB family protein [Dactylosporangium siamense]GIG42782.1 peptidase [Dactylosporangium siamense]
MRGIRRGRYDNLRRIQGSDPGTDYLLIHQLTLREEFPWDMRMAFNLAFNRSFALPRVAEGLVRTGRVLTEPRRRADDTGIIMYEILLHGFEHPRGRLALRLLNEAHHNVAADPADSVYVLAALVVVPMRWLQRYGWRTPDEHEREAAARYYREVGLRMGIRDIPSGYGAFEAWFDAYEAAHLRHSPEAERIERVTRELLRGRVPKPLRGVADALIAALYDPPLRRAYAVPDPPAWARTGLHVALRARALLLRLARPRTTPLFADGIVTKSYPDGYDLAKLRQRSS